MYSLVCHHLARARHRLNAAIFSVVSPCCGDRSRIRMLPELSVVEADTRVLPSAYSSSGAVFDVRGSRLNRVVDMEKLFT